MINTLSDILKNTLKFSFCQVVAFTIGIFFSEIELNQTGIQNIQGMLYCLLSQSCNVTLFTTMDAILEEMMLFIQEYRDGIYRSDSYYISKVISLVGYSYVLRVVPCKAS